MDMITSRVARSARRRSCSRSKSDSIHSYERACVRVGFCRENPCICNEILAAGTSRLNFGWSKEDLGQPSHLYMYTSTWVPNITKHHKQETVQRAVTSIPVRNREVIIILGSTESLTRYVKKGISIRPDIPKPKMTTDPGFLVIFQSVAHIY